ncbi:hypothetical protein WS50_15325 [Burkholderia territorii]|uniref:hypothetical protein n=1 Tax=Burkholderia territorii TaxID=1503055 RepID=UPI00075E4F07|nr:hypothetical protein [Burkholderia territorii]KUY96876.1 hypothetical protein WS47_07265 [Burkholderia territorii]KUZ16415.1 hypothetical protein WS50_15325 [Burkholderia territorii]
MKLQFSIVFSSTLAAPATIATELLTQLGGGRAWSCLAILAVAGLLLAAASTVRLVMATIRRYERGRATRIMQMRHPHCHVKRLANGQWLLIDKDTGTVYIPPRLSHPPINEWI